MSDKAPVEQKKGQQAKMTKEEKAAAKALVAFEKQKKAALKEGGKKGQDLEGMADMGGCSYFHVALEDCQGNHELVVLAMQGANKVVDPEGEDRRGGAGHVAKCFFSTSDSMLVCHLHLPEIRTEMTLKEWVDETVKNLKEADGGGAKVTVVSQDERTAVLEIPADADSGIFPLKVRDYAINRGFDFLRAKQLVPEQMSSDDECYLPDDW
jgi:lysyl-tRNA synthetase class 2